MPKRKNERMNVDLPTRFRPTFWISADGRSQAVREIRQRYKRLKADTGTDSYQKDLLCQRAVFIAIQLESMEVSASQGRPFDAGQYVQATNSLLGLLKALGLDKQVSKVVNLKAYVAERSS